jgi:virulence-associated protein VagC
MKTIIEAKVFKNGGSNAIRLPKSVELSGTSVFLELDEETQTLILHTTKPQPFAKLFQIQAEHSVELNRDWNFERVDFDYETRESLKALDSSSDAAKAS